MQKTTTLVSALSLVLAGSAAQDKVEQKKVAGQSKQGKMCLKKNQLRKKLLKKAIPTFAEHLLPIF